jgi:hypothetical protein
MESGQLSLSIRRQTFVLNNNDPWARIHTRDCAKTALEYCGLISRATARSVLLRKRNKAADASLDPSASGLAAGQLACSRQSRDREPATHSIMSAVQLAIHASANVLRRALM